MKLYHCNGSRSARVLWMLEELGLDYQIDVLPFDAAALQSVDYFDLPGAGKMPVLVVDGKTMYESVPIVQYLIEHFAEGKLEPPRRSPHFGPLLKWMHFGETTLMGPVSQVAQHHKLLPPAERSADIAGEGARSFKHYAEELEHALAGHAYLLGDFFSPADIVVGYTLYAAKHHAELPLSAALDAYYARLASRPAFTKAFA